ncbi:Small GTPase like protein [Aduncisulcus paluster]|uniref:Small GTPase like protein n=1 Tax=Aduncisulcus paluster TaxID=2918883 RepID=A0ABQ5KY41_9EUKA|nr:Small GTPase like protein [Aduncisulcus paluster]
MAEEVYKILLVGESGVGKSAILLRFADDMFSEGFVTTVGIDFKNKDVKVDGKLITLQLWDSAGQERFKTIVKSYFRSADAVILAYDVTDEKSFKRVEYWISSIERGSPEGCVKVIVGNKCDLKLRRVVTSDRGEACAGSHSCPYFETSAKTGVGVNKVFMYIAEKLSRGARKPAEVSLTDQLQLDQTPSSEGTGCCGK